MSNKGKGKSNVNNEECNTTYDNIATKEDARVQVQSVFTIEIFDHTKFQWKRWVKRLEVAFKVFNTSTTNKVPYLLHYMGAEAYDILSDKLAPEEPISKSYDELVGLMDNYYSPAPLEIAENFRFYRRVQQEGENVQEFLASLQKLAINCNFGSYLKTALRNQLVFGLQSEKIQNRLLETKDLTLDRAIEIAVSLELSGKDAAQLKKHAGTTSGTIGAVGIVSPQKRKILNKSFNKNTFEKPLNLQSQAKCYRCSKVGHLANKCDKINVICNFCKVKGHIQRACLKAKRVHKATANQLEAVSEEIMHLEEEHVDHREKFYVTLKVDDQMLEFEVDSGAAVTVIGKCQFDKYFSNSLITNTDLKLISYCKKRLDVLGFKRVKVLHNNVLHNLNIYIVDGSRNFLLGREWIRQLNINIWNPIKELECTNNSINTEKVINEFKFKYESVFTPGIGKITGIQARLKIKENTTPIFIKARSVPFALLSKVETELQNLVDQGVITKVNHSDWATPIVPVVKPNGKIRICGDFKVTINQFLEIDEHPLPTIDELFASMAGGVKFSKLDLSQAYLHMEIHPDDRHLLTLNTHKGLYQCSRLMFGISSAPAIWQRTMENILRDIPGVTVFLDDIKITGPTDEIHLKRLEQVIQRLQEYNLKINIDKCQFLMNAIQYCGYTIDKNGIHKMKSKIDAIQKAPRPVDKQQVRAFIGLVNYYGRFFKNLSTILVPLNKLLRNDTKFIWNKECERSFKLIKNEMQSDQILAHFEPNLPLILATDASPYGVGAVLSHLYPDGTERPIQFASKTLTDTQRKYAQLTAKHIV